jgi:hypothetical protein
MVWIGVRVAVRSNPKRPITNRPQIDNLPHGNCETALTLVFNGDAAQR